MNRREMIAVIGIFIGAGCTTSPGTHYLDNDDDDDEEPRFTDERELNRDSHLSARWVEEAPDDIDPYPSDKQPVAYYTVVLELFEEAVEQDEWQPPDDRTPHSDIMAGEPVSVTISQEKEQELRGEFSDLGIQGGEEYPGMYFNHDGTIIVLHILSDD